MATIQPVFELTISGTGSVQTDTWVDLGAITSGKQIIIGYASYIAIDKNTQFETRSNTAGQSTGTTGNTTLHDWASAIGGSGTDRDFYQNGNTETATIVSTGVEHWWLRVTSQENSSGGFNYIMHYTQQ